MTDCSAIEEQEWRFIWRLLRESRAVVIGADDVVMCTICRRLMIECHAGPCGCRYCLDCIVDYVSDGHLFCPGLRLVCRQEVLEIGANVCPDLPMNRRIADLTARCRYLCAFRGPLRLMKDHEKECKRRLAGGQSCADADWTDSVSVTSDADDQSVGTPNECETRCRSEIELLRRDVIALRGALRDVSHERDDMQREVERQDTDLAGLRQELRAVRTALEEEQNRGRDWTETVNRVTDELVNLKNQTILVKADNDTQSCRTEVKVENLNCGTFEWRIDHWAAHREAARNDTVPRILSDPFLSHRNGYKMCLSVKPDGVGEGKGVYLTIEFHLMRGPFDGVLPWPFRGAVTLSLVNKDSSHDQFCETICFSQFPKSVNWNRPTSERNRGFGCYQVVGLAELAGNPALCQDDCVFIRCVVVLDPITDQKS